MIKSHNDNARTDLKNQQQIANTSISEQIKEAKNNKESRSVSKLREQMNQQRQNLKSRQSNIQQNNRSNSSSQAIQNALGGGMNNKSFYQTKTDGFHKNLLDFSNNTTNKCQHFDCSRSSFKANLCKHHFCASVKVALRKQLRNIFRGPEKAYSSMDFYGRGYITEDDLLNSIVMQRILPFNKEDVREFSRMYNLFNSKVQPTNANGGGANGIGIGQGNMKNSSSNISMAIQHTLPATNQPSQTNKLVVGMNFDQFKRIFFPQLYLIDEEHDSDDDRKRKKSQLDLNANIQESKGKNQPESVITDRLKKLEKILKDKFQNQWESVRKAFLALDTDYDGYITVEDILRYFGQGEKDLNYNDLKKLIKDKDSKKVGKIGYTDFSKWVGNSIHQSEGFYFRHDSIKNPQFEANNERNEQNKNNISKLKAQESLINQNLEKTVLDKIQFQWKTLRKAFMDLNMEKSGSIMPEELRFYFQHWGLNLTDEQFRYLFDKFDLDGDGKISYKDFQLTVGSEIHPAEGLYFRQDKPQQVKINSCKHDKCWQGTSGQQSYCGLHLKLHQDECSTLFGRFFAQLKTKWPKFIESIKQIADQDDKNQVFFDDFMAVLKKFKINLTQKEQTMILDSFQGRDEKDRRRVNVGRLYDHKFTMMLQKIYQKVDVHDNDGDDDPVDQSGYTGQFYRPQTKPLIPITEEELVQIIAKTNKLVEIIRTIKEIDKQHNGFVTTTELDDILKIQYKEELGDRDLKHIMKKYASIQNRVLVDYKKFRDSMVQQIKLVNSGFTYKSGGYSSAAITPQKDKNQKYNNQLQTMQPKKDDIFQAQALDNNQNFGNYQSSNNQNNHNKMQRYESSKSVSQDRTAKKYNDHKNSVTVSNLLEQQEQMNKTIDYNQSKHDNGTIMISELIRPQTKQQGTHIGQKANDNNDFAPYQNNFKSDLLNRTMTMKHKSNLLSSSDIGNNKFDLINKTPSLQASRLKLKKLSSTLDHSKIFQYQINDYSDFHVKNDQNQIDNKLIRDNLKRAQSSHGIFGSRANYGSISIQNKNNSGINNLLQNLRKQRRNISTTSQQMKGGAYATEEDNSYEALDNFLSKALNTQSDANLPDNSKQTLASSNQKNLDQYNRQPKNYYSLQQSKIKLEQINSRNINADPLSMTISRDQIHNFSTLNATNKQQSLDPFSMTINQPLNDSKQIPSQSLYQTLNTSTMTNSIFNGNKFKSVLKSKLSYEWKNVYRILSQLDKSTSGGQVSISDLQSALDQYHVFMTKEELKKIQSLYGSSIESENNQNNMVNYQMLSIDLGLHNQSLNYLKNHSVRMQNIQKLRNIYSSSDKKGRLNEISSAAGISRDRISRGGRARNLNNSMIERIKTAAEGGGSRAQNYFNHQFKSQSLHRDQNANQDQNQNQHDNIDIQIGEMSENQNYQQEIKDKLIQKIKEFRDLILVYQKKNNNDEGIIQIHDFKTLLKSIGINLPSQDLQRFIVSNQKKEEEARSKSAIVFQKNSNKIEVNAKEFLKFYI